MTHRPPSTRSAGSPRPRAATPPFIHVEPVTAAAYGIEPGPRTWREVAGEVERLRTAYASAGYGPGHRVGLLLENRPAFFTHWLALNALGISIVPIHEDMRSAEWSYLISHSEMVLAVVQPAARGRPARGGELGRRPARHDPARGRRPDSRRRARRRAAAASRSAATPSAPCSTPRGPPASPRAAASPTATSCAPASGTSASASWRRCGPTSSASSRRCRSAT